MYISTERIEWFVSMNPYTATYGYSDTVPGKLECFELIIIECGPCGRGSRQGSTEDFEFNVEAPNQ